jgi:hypothetical protein
MKKTVGIRAKEVDICPFWPTERETKIKVEVANRPPTAMKGMARKDRDVGTADNAGACRRTVRTSRGAGKFPACPPAAFEPVVKRGSASLDCQCRAKLALENKISTTGSTNLPLVEGVATLKEICQGRLRFEARN